MLCTERLHRHAELASVWEGTLPQSQQALTWFAGMFLADVAHKSPENLALLHVGLFCIKVMEIIGAQRRLEQYVLGAVCLQVQQLLLLASVVGYTLLPVTLPVCMLMHSCVCLQLTWYGPGDAALKNLLSGMLLCKLAPLAYFIWDQQVRCQA